MTQNGLILLKTVDIKPRTQQIQYAYNIYAVLYSFYNKRTFSYFWRNGPKNVESEGLLFIFCQICLHVD